VPRMADQRPATVRPAAVTPTSPAHAAVSSRAHLGERARAGMARPLLGGAAGSQDDEDLTTHHVRDRDRRPAWARLGAPHGSLALCYLCAHEGTGVEEALAAITRARPRVSLSRVQRAFVDEYLGFHREREAAGPA
jgi:hypothetical protein